MHESSELYSKQENPALYKKQTHSNFKENNGKAIAYRLKNGSDPKAWFLISGT